MKIPQSNSIFWRLFGVILLLPLVLLTICAWLEAGSLGKSAEEQQKQELIRQGLALETATAAAYHDNSYNKLFASLQAEKELPFSRLRIVAPSGKVLADSETGFRQDKDGGQLISPELFAAGRGKVGTREYFDQFSHQDVLLVSIPLSATPAAGTNPASYMLLTAPAVSFSLFSDGWLLRKYALLFVLGACGAGLLAFFLHRMVAAPLQEIEFGIDGFSETNFKTATRLRYFHSPFYELDRLSRAIRKLTENLSERINEAEHRHSELDAVFSSMVEAVMIIDANERLINLNKAAARLMGAEETRLKNKFLLECLRNEELHRFVLKSLGSKEPLEGEIILRNEQDEDIFLQAHGMLLRNTGSERPAALIVLNDITNLIRLENIRRDFVANVSHELRTPITTIKGFVETLRDGAMDEPEDARHFLDIILKHADRLNAIVEDLLTLSRIEQEDKNAEIVLTQEDLKKTLKDALETCTVSAAQKGISIVLDCPDSFLVHINGHLLCQAVTNLIVNAIKYSEPQSEVLVEAFRQENWTHIRVQDSGTGIAKEHLPRLFERFYRSDKARSRKLGGTGLGLAIVKHIVQAHNGQVSVDSEVGRGTTFTIKLPALIPLQKTGKGPRPALANDRSITSSAALPFANMS